MRFVLASASPARLSVLRSAGVDPLVKVSGVDEDAVTASLTDPAPAELVTALAQAKAEAVARELEEPDAVVVGCDSMLLKADGEIVGKPGTPEVAAKRWTQNAGTSAELLTGHAIIVVRGGEIADRAADHLSTTVRFGSPSEAEVDAYVATGEPLHVAGGFTLEGFGGWFVEGVDGDPSSVLGISLPLTRKLLSNLGLSITDLWNRPSTTS
ncbi:septum formation inhibitor Maf [Saccharopolyspora rhizosphaerae]|uniref:Nucleoside triphosphate pyrophosphatase n=1 Tax=Saccharopolyspora rhizosphaerae TaxID=2492662 RepID=A0A426JHY1_9PSEU|nr:nucleoside triphosphate pyrophosphatase [Saccharopolyspora rhizosphaerae]RRO12772.1 septum formation inhibitor Maf [Saccharopolyspora rhizosphaerae]